MEKYVLININFYASRFTICWEITKAKHDQIEQRTLMVTHLYGMEVYCIKGEYVEKKERKKPA